MIKWKYKHFYMVKNILKFINDSNIVNYGIINDNESFLGGYYLIYKA